MITLIKYGRTTNLQDYNSERIDAEYQLAEGENATIALANLKAFVTTGVIQEEKKITTTEAKVKEDIKEVEVEVEVEESTVANKKVAKKATKKTATPKPNIKYSREDKAHKTTLAEILDSEFPTWKKEMLSKAKEVSIALEGEDIYSPKGELLPSFKESVIEGMSDSEL